MLKPKQGRPATRVPSLRIADTSDAANRHPPLRLPALLVSIMVLAACTSTTPVPDPAIAAARSAITNAERSDASRYAGAELSTARQRLAAAESAALTRDMSKALQFAEQAKVEAELAQARAEVAKALAINAELQRNTEVLIQELQRRGDQR
jgi:hypothetical protein